MVGRPTDRRNADICRWHSCGVSANPMAVSIRRDNTHRALSTGQTALCGHHHQGTPREQGGE